MNRVAIVGAGKIGGAIAKHLYHCGDYDVVVGDFEQQALDRLTRHLPVAIKQIDVLNQTELDGFLKGVDVVISACSYRLNIRIAEAALRVGCSYFDLTEDVATTAAVRKIAEQAVVGQIFMPQCGLAPGYIGILGNHLCSQFDEPERVKMRVGALPQFPSNMMMYNLTWSTDGLVNEYCNLCEAIVDGRRIEVLPLEGIEHFSMDGIDYEAFNTSGGLGTLAETLEGKVKALDYKTVRYKGHCYLMTFLTKSLRLAKKKDLLLEILEDAVPITMQDVVLIFCSVSGKRDGQLTQITDARKIYHRELYGEHWSSIQLTTSSSIAAVVDLHREGKLPNRGFVRQENVNFDELSANRFGQFYTVE
ncbi:MAG: saccharopine dehydrogenase NADP-binding domain-containing protein [Pseudomonadales bacterium]|nr:saccharopine dehydrogenase NADP-binding domain-containing protein [Pseudomonadales bacterium]